MFCTSTVIHIQFMYSLSEAYFYKILLHIFVLFWYVKVSNSSLMLYKMNTMQKVCSEVGLKGAFCHSRCEDHHCY